MKTSKKGISLIVLVITIIVMIILAASVVILLSNSGVIDKANYAVRITDKKQVEQIAALAWADAYTDGKRSVAELKEAVDAAMLSNNVDTNKYDINVTEIGVNVTYKPILSAGLAQFEIKGITLGGFKTSLEYHEETGNYPIVITGMSEPPSKLKEVRVYIKVNGESDDNYTQAEVMLYPDTTKIKNISGGTIEASVATPVIISNLDRDTSWIIKVVYEYEDGKIYYNVSEPTEIACFAAGTKVYTENGLMNIEDVKEGMKVYSRNFATGENELKTVLVTSERTIRTVSYRIAANGELIESTDNHPYYIKGKGFVEAKDLKVGDVLIDINNNEYAIDNIEVVNNTDVITVYNMNVDGNHNYFVGEMMVLVHNAVCPN